MATSYTVAVLNENHQPIQGITVEAIELSTLTVSDTQDTGNDGTALFTGLSGAHWFKPLTRRTSATVGNRIFTGKVQIQIVSITESGNQGICTDYVVDSAGGGTHTALFGASGALEAAIADAANRTIWVCSGHSETVTATYEMSPLATSQRIFVRGFGNDRPRLTVGSGVTNFWRHQSGSSGVESVLRIENIGFNRPGAVTAGPFFVLDGGDAVPFLEFVDCTWVGGDSQWTIFFTSRSVSGGIWQDMLLERCFIRSAQGDLFRTNASSSSQGDLRIRNCHFEQLDSIFNRVGATDVDPFDSVAISDTTFEALTTMAWHRQTNNPFTFSDNILNDFSGSAALFSLNLTTTAINVLDVSITGNYIRVTGSGSVARLRASGSRTAANVNISANALRGPSSGTAILVDSNITLSDCLLLNAYRDWTTNVGGATALGFGGDHGSLGGLSDDDHSIYGLLAGRSGGQTLIGGTATGEDLILQSNTSNDGSVFLGSSSVFELNEATGQLLLPTTGSGAGLLVGGDAAIYRGAANQFWTPDALVFVPSAAQDITAVGEVILANAQIVQLTADASYTLTSTPTIADGSDGQLLYIINVDSTDVITVQDESNLTGSNLRLTGATDVAIGPMDILVLAFNSTIGDWLEVSFSAN